MTKSAIVFFPWWFQTLPIFVKDRDPFHLVFLVLYYL